MASPSQIADIGLLLKDTKRPLKERFRALFTLRNLGGEESIAAIASAFSDQSVLLKHELAYCLGQMRDPVAIPTLVSLLQDVTQEPIVRHEAGEALGAIGDTSVLNILEEYSKDEVVEVAETCQLAVGRMKYFNSDESRHFKGLEKFNSVDPTPPSGETDFDKLKETLLGNHDNLFDRYRAMFALRNMNSAESAKVLALGLRTGSALFRHEIGFVLGQMECDDAQVVEHLSAVVRDTSESGMVRHEAAEALGAIASPMAVEVLKEHLSDPVDVVRESCQVALDMSDYYNSSEFQYANALRNV